MKRVFSLIVSLLLSFSAGAIGSMATIASVTTWYATLVRPALSPPNWVFAPVWSTLYTFMAIAAWRVWEKQGSDRRAPAALAVYAAHLIVNALWSLVFFGLQAPLLGLGVILILDLLVLYLTIRFYHIDRIAGLLFIPYLLWVSFATYLNVMIVVLN